MRLEGLPSAWSQAQMKFMVYLGLKMFKVNYNLHEMQNVNIE